MPDQRRYSPAQLARRRARQQRARSDHGYNPANPATQPRETPQETPNAQQHDH